MSFESRSEGKEMTEVALEEVRIHSTKCPQHINNHGGKWFGGEVRRIMDELNAMDSGEDYFYQGLLHGASELLFMAVHRIEHGSTDPWDCTCQDMRGEGW
jgi:hypothetical protein